MDQQASERAATEMYDREFGDFERRLDASYDRWRASADRLRHFARRWVLEGYVKRDIDVLVSMVTDDFTHEDPLNVGRTVRGPGEFRQILEDTFRAFPDSTFAGDGAPFLSTDSDTIVVPWRALGTFAGPLSWGPPGSARDLQPTGRRFDFTGVDMYTLRGEKVCAMRSFYDPIQVAQQLGLAPTSGSALLRIAPWPQALIAQAQRLTSR